jgi:hypothetical protein
LLVVQPNDWLAGRAEIGIMRGCLALAVIAASSTVWVPPAVAEPRAVVELFTSQGCSSCPAADRLLGELATDPSLVALSLSIDVWDYLGWKDTLASPRNTARWQGYSKSRGDRERYTPQVVVNGAVHALGSDRAAIDAAIIKSRQNEAAMSVPVNAVRSGDQLAIVLPSGAPAVAAHVSVWALAKSVTVAITRGENKGRTITYHNVVRRWIDLGPWNAATNRWSVPLRDLAGDGIEMAAVLVQTGTHEMPSMTLGAVIAPLR